MGLSLAQALCAVLAFSAPRAVVATRARHNVLLTKGSVLLTTAPPRLPPASQPAPTPASPLPPLAPPPGPDLVAPAGLPRGGPAAVHPQAAAGEAGSGTVALFERLPVLQVPTSPWLLINMATCVVWVTLVLVAARFHGSEHPCATRTGKNVEGKHLGAGGVTDWSFRVWKYQLFDFMSDPGMLTWSALCPGIRWADSLSTAGIVPFRAALALFLALACLDWLFLGWGSELALRSAFSAQPSAPTLLLACAAVLVASRWGAAAWVAFFCRRRMRAVFQMEKQPGSLLTDALAHFCCGGLAIMQEARHVEAAWRAGHSATAARPAHSAGQ